MSEDANPANVKPPSVDRLSQLWRRINDHKVMQWTIAYVAVAYGIQHGVTLTREAFEWPQAVERVTMLLFILGLPVAITLAWYQGAQASRRFSAGECTIISLLLVGISILFYAFVQPSRETVAGSPAIQQASVTAARRAAADPHGAISLAVLPFDNLSADKDQEFFSDGMTEEITSALAKIPDLRVVGRASAFQFKGQNKDLRAIGLALSATHLLEGSVRKAGNRLRITAELVNADNGVSVWTDSYDRDMTDVFAIQEDIARAIAASLRMPLGLKPGENLVSNRNIDPELYQQFLRLRARIGAASTLTTRRAALPEFERLVSRDPAFAPGWGYLSRLYIDTETVPLDRTIWDRPPDETRRLMQSAIAKAEKAAREAIRLDSRQAFAYAGLALIETIRKNWASADDLYRKALELDPYDPELMVADGAFRFQTGRVSDAVGVFEQAQGLEPLAGGPPRYLALALLAQNKPDAAIAVFQMAPPRQGAGYAALALAYAMSGHFDKAADEILLANMGPAFGKTGQPDEAARLMRLAPAKVADPSALRPLFHWFDWVYGYVGAEGRLLDYPERALQAGEPSGAQLFAPNYAKVRKTDRFKKLIRGYGLVDYWKARGWPDLCHPMGADDFVCE